MDLFDGIREELDRMLEKWQECRVTKDVTADSFAWDSVENQLLMKSDAVAELGGGNLPAVSGILYADDTATSLADAGTSRTDAASSLVDAATSQTDTDAAPKIQVTLYGTDLSGLRGDVPYARITIAHIRTDFLTEQFKQYNLFRSIEYIRFRVNPRGYMPRISTARNREQVRVAGEALQRGLDFYKVGRIYGEAYLKHPAVERVSTIFITLPDFDYRALQNLFDRAESAVMSLEHTLNDLKMDCSSCNLKEVCDEVEKLCDAGKTPTSI